MAANNANERKADRRLPVWICIPLFILVFWIFMMIYGLVAQGFLSWASGGKAPCPEALRYILLEGSMLLAVLTAAAVMLWMEKRPFADLGLTLRGHAKGLWYGLLMACGIYLTGFGLSWAMGEVEVTAIRFQPSDLAGSWLFFLLVALFEEIMVRGYILGRLLRTSLNKYLSLLLSASLFALLHIFNPEVAFLPMVNLVLAGMLLGASCLYTRNLAFPISLHLFWNWIQGPVLGYQVSGNSFLPTMLTLRIPEANVLNGGAFGFEGSLICTVLLLACTALIVRWGERRRRHGQSCGTPTMLS